MANRPIKRWTTTEVEYLRINYGVLSNKDVCAYLKRSPKSVMGKAYLLGLCESGKFRWFTEAEKEIIRNNYSERGATGVAKMIGRDRDVIKQWAHHNGIRVSKEYRTSASVRANKSWVRSEETKRKIGLGHRKETSQLRDIMRPLLWPVWIYPIMKRDGFKCQSCNHTGALDVHHLRRLKAIVNKVVAANPHLSLQTVHDRYLMAQLIVLDHSLADGITLCRKCHNSIHHKKRDELREHLNAETTAHGNPQPSQLNVIKIVDWKVQRLTGEDSQTNKPDTSVPHVNNVMR